MTEFESENESPDGIGGQWTDPRRRRPPQRRQVHPGQPDHRSARGRRRGRPGRDPRPDLLRRDLERPRVHRRRHRRLGPRRARPRRADPRPGGDRGRPGRRGAVRGRRDRRHHRRRRVRGPDPAEVREAGDPGRQQGRRRTRRGGGVRRSGTSASASPTRSRPCTAAAPATCSTPSWRRCPRRPAESFDEVRGPRRIAIVGKPNVGKSSLLNQLAGEERAVVDNVAGTTVDPVDELVELGGRTWRFIDTAGIRKRVKEASGHEYYASLRTSTAIDRAEVAVLVLDGSQSVSEQDVRIIQTVRESGRALVIAFNKWDLVDEERRYYLDREIERDLVQVQWAPRINVTARTGWHVDRLVPALDKALEGWETRVPTGALNTFLGRLVAEHPHPVRSGKQPKILFGTQPSTSPPDVRAVHQRQAGGVVRALHRAPAARAVRLRRHADRASTSVRGRSASGSFRGCAPPASCARPSPCLARRVASVRFGAGSRDRQRDAAPSSTSGRRAACPTFPADNWWHADVSKLPVHARSADWLSHMSTDVDLHPDFGPSYGDGPNYGIPVTVVSGDHAKVRVRFDYASESDKVRYPLGPGHPDRGRPQLGRRQARRRRRQEQLQALRDLEHPGLRHHLARRFRRRVVADVATSCGPTAGPPPTPPGCRSCRACCAGRRSATAPSTTPSASPPRDQQPPPVAGPARRRLDVVAGLPADGRAVPARRPASRPAATAPRRARSSRR